jgi:precorrin isomerase
MTVLFGSTPTPAVRNEGHRGGGPVAGKNDVVFVR